MTDFTPAQLAHIENHRNWNVEHIDWWESTYEYFVEMTKEIGLDVSSNDISFSGFWSQGDGASFVFVSYGLGRVLDGCVKWLAENERPEDQNGYMYALWSFATSFVAEFEKYRLLGQDFIDNVLNDVQIRAVRTGHHYVHSNTVTTEFDTSSLRGEWDDQATDAKFYDSCSEFGIDAMIECIADGLYHDLEEEHDYQTSDEAVWEALEANDIKPEEEAEEDECEAD